MCIKLLLLAVVKENGLLRFRDFTYATCPVLKSADERASKLGNTKKKKNLVRLKALLAAT